MLFLRSSTLDRRCQRLQSYLYNKYHEIDVLVKCGFDSVKKTLRLCEISCVISCILQFWMCHPLYLNFLHFYSVFTKNLAEQYVGTPLGLAPPLGNPESALYYFNMIFRSLILMTHDLVTSHVLNPKILDLLVEDRSHIKMSSSSSLTEVEKSSRLSDSCFRLSTVSWKGVSILSWTSCSATCRDEQYIVSG